jgi:helicase required for RNAi-mediated heterochromatin assembly 1
MSRNLLLDTDFQVPNSPRQSESPGKWQAYVNGGAQVDDARLLQKRKEEDAAYQEARRYGTPQLAATTATDVDALTMAAKLIETSPRKPRGSTNTNLLVDIDIDTSYRASQQQQSVGSYAGAVRSKGTANEGSEYSLLD